MESTRKTWLTQNWNTFASSLLVHGLSQLGIRGFLFRLDIVMRPSSQPYSLILISM